MSAVAQQRQYTYQDYQRMRDASEGGAVKLEYADGAVYAMAGGTLAHGELSVSISSLLRVALHGFCKVYPSDVAIYVEAADAAYYPDVSVACGLIETKPGDKKVITNPSLIVEVLSPSTEANDRGKKLADYKLLPSLHAVLLVSQHRPEIIVVERVGGAGTLRGSRDGWQPTVARAGDVITLEAPHVQLRVDDIYAGIELTPP